ncbi:MAG: hypothetical protein COA78_16865 [Blastopirellula sp.]|nr:MAG: hypothetical protein COA78_16865 [Blastopirellula sp.]
MNNLRKLNPAAEIYDAENLPSAHTLLIVDVCDPATRLTAIESWQQVSNHAHKHPNHAADIQSISIEIEKPLEWNAFGLWLSFLLHKYGDRLLRLKGILHIEGEPLPIAIHWVQHTIHPPQHLAKWPTETRNSKLVFIYRELNPDLLKKSLNVFLSL